MRETPKVLAALGVIYLVWGTSYLAIGKGVQVVDPLVFTGLRFLIAAPLMLILALYCSERLPGKLREWCFILASGLLLMGISSGLMAWGQQHVESADAALIMSTSALWLILFSALGRNATAPSRRSWCCLSAGMVGLALVIEPQPEIPETMLLAYLAILAAAVSLSVSTILVKRYGSPSNPLMTASIHLFLSGIALTLLGRSMLAAPHPNWNQDSILALLYLATMNSFIAVAAYYWLIHKVGPALLASPAYVTPAIALIAGQFLAEESLSPGQAGGATLILLSVFLLIKPAKMTPQELIDPGLAQNNSKPTSPQ